MKSYDLFPIEKFLPRAREAILAEFNGRCPTIGEAAAISDAKWLQLPGFGPGALVVMRQITRGLVRKAPARSGMTDAALLAERDRLQRETSSLRQALHLHKHQLRTIMAELRARNLLSQQEKLQRDFPSHTPAT
jgi:hypothetical protein